MTSNIGESIKTLCKANNIPFSKLEKETGISNGQISRWVASSPSVENANKVADYFNVSIDYLLGKEEQKPVNSEIQSVIAQMQDMTKEEQKQVRDIVNVLHKK
ncbi:helix-turn-helix domain-containing protein [Staphylococcus arlettae]